ncbi:MAG: hypothetical protein Q7W51_06075 [Coriobacteriia bacterium]|nr:hypothetical protein [Coriobacteriia bacterium]
MHLRDKVIDCLLSTHGDYFARSRAALGLDSSAAAVRSTAQGMVALAFQSVGGSYDAPTLPVLAKVVNLLSERALDWGAEPDSIFHCHCELMQDVGKLELLQSSESDAMRRRN